MVDTWFQVLGKPMNSSKKLILAAVTISTVQFTPLWLLKFKRSSAFQVFWYVFLSTKSMFQYLQMTIAHERDEMEIKPLRSI